MERSSPKRLRVRKVILVPRLIQAPMLGHKVVTRTTMSESREAWMSLRTSTALRTQSRRRNRHKTGHSCLLARQLSTCDPCHLHNALTSHKCMCTCGACSWTLCMGHMWGLLMDTLQLARCPLCLRAVSHLAGVAQRANKVDTVAFARKAQPWPLRKCRGYTARAYLAQHARHVASECPVVAGTHCCNGWVVLVE